MALGFERDKTLGRKGSKERFDRLGERGMHPAWRNFGERGQHECPEMSAGVGQDGVGLAPDQASEGDDIEIERAGGVHRGGPSAGLAFERLERSEQGFRGGMAGQPGDAVDVIRLAGGRHRRACPPPGEGDES